MMEIFELRNGINVILLPMVGRVGVVAEVMVKMGSKFERKEEFGVSHFLEHMAFKGTERWLTAEALSQEIDGEGAGCNAETSEETVSYYIKTSKERVVWALELLSEIVLRPSIPVVEVERERGVIMEEIKMYKDNPIMGLGDEFMKRFLANSEIGCWDVAGEVEEVMRINRETLCNYRNNYLNPKEMVIVVAGGVNKLQIPSIRCQMEEIFGGFKNEKAIELPEVRIQYGQEKEWKVEKGSVEQGHFVIGCEGIRRGDRRRAVFRTMELILAGSMSSRLYGELREKRGWAYYVSPQSKSLVEGGVFAIQTGVRKEKLKEAIDLVEKEIIGLSSSLENEEVERAKKQIEGRMMMAADDIEFWVGALAGRYLLEGELFDLMKEMREAEEVVLEEVRDLAGEMFNGDNLRKLVVSR